MAYAAIADMTTRFNATELIKCTDRANSGSRNDTVLQAALDDAFGIMNSQIGRWYALPIVGTASGAMIACQCDIAHWLLYIGDKPDNIHVRYEEWKKWLDDVATGAAGLGMDTPPATISSTLISVTQPCTTANAGNRWFTQDRMEDF